MRHYLRRYVWFDESGLIAMEMTAQAVPDGYTLLVISGSLIASAGVQNKVRFGVLLAKEIENWRRLVKLPGFAESLR